MPSSMSCQIRQVQIAESCRQDRIGAEYELSIPPSLGCRRVWIAESAEFGLPPSTSCRICQAQIATDPPMHMFFDLRPFLLLHVTVSRGGLLHPLLHGILLVVVVATMVDCCILYVASTASSSNTLNNTFSLSFVMLMFALMEVCLRRWIVVFVLFVLPYPSQSSSKHS